MKKILCLIGFIIAFSIFASCAYASIVLKVLAVVAHSARIPQGALHPEAATGKSHRLRRNRPVFSARMRQIGQGKTLRNGGPAW